MLIGVDYHPSFQQIAFLVEETGEYNERRLNHSDGEAEKFYRDLQQRGVHVRVGMEATGYSRWFERLLAELSLVVASSDGWTIRTADRTASAHYEHTLVITNDEPMLLTAA
jgi:transposase